MLCAQQHLFPTVKLLITLPLVGLAFLPLLGLLNHLHRQLEHLFHTFYEDVNSLKVGLVNVSYQVHWGHRFKPIIEVERCIPRSW